METSACWAAADVPECVLANLCSRVSASLNYHHHLEPATSSAFGDLAKWIFQKFGIT